jgi:hypothetical protein
VTRTQRLLKIQAEVEAAARELHRERCRAWRAKYPERSREASRKWREKNPQDYHLSQRAWKAFYPEKNRAIAKAWRDKNPNYQREYRARRKAAALAAQASP